MTIIECQNYTIIICKDLESPIAFPHCPTCIVIVSLISLVTLLRLSFTKHDRGRVQQAAVLIALRLLISHSWLPGVYLVYYTEGVFMRVVFTLWADYNFNYSCSEVNKPLLFECLCSTNFRKWNVTHTYKLYIWYIILKKKVQALLSYIIGYHGYKHSLRNLQ